MKVDSAETRMTSREVMKSLETRNSRRRFVSDVGGVVATAAVGVDSEKLVKNLEKMCECRLGARQAGDRGGHSRRSWREDQEGPAHGDRC